MVDKAPHSQAHTYIGRFGISLSQLLNVILGGDPDETLSSRCGKLRTRCILCKYLCSALNLIDSKHCRDAIEPDEGVKVDGQH